MEVMTSLSKTSMSVKKIEDIKAIFHSVLTIIGRDKRISSRYIEGLVYSLLSTLRANDQERFLTYLISFLNTFDNKEVSDFMKRLYEVLPLTESDFQKLGYLIIIGLMSIKGGE